MRWFSRDKKPSRPAPVVSPPRGGGPLESRWTPTPPVPGEEPTSFEDVTEQERAERAAHWGEWQDEPAEAARRMVLPGFHTNAGAKLAMYEQWSDEAPGVEVLDALVDEVWNARLREQQQWDGSGDYDRMCTAYAALEQQRIIARMNFSCCQNCGLGEITDEVEDLEQWRGYVFFHQQAAEDLEPEPGAVNLHFGVLPNRAAVRAEQIGTETASALQAGGLDVDWDGSAERSILVRDLRWRKPLPG